MSDDFVALLTRMKADREKHHARLVRWKNAGGQLENYPEHETIDDFIAREANAVENLSRAIDRYNQRNT